MLQYTALMSVQLLLLLWILHWVCARHLPRVIFQEKVAGLGVFMHARVHFVDTVGIDRQLRRVQCILLHCLITTVYLCCRGAAHCCA